MPQYRHYRDPYQRFREDETEEEAYESIARDVGHIWRSKWWSGKIRDDETQLALITAMQEKYVYPNFLELVGPPSPDDYCSNGHLTVSRKAELLLIGTFLWKNITIAKHPSVFGYERDRYLLSKVPRWTVDDKGWYVCQETLPQELSYDGFFTPFLGQQVQKLGDYLAGREEPLKDRHGSLPIDGNVYNCLSENLRVINLRGRPMRCKRCGRRVLPEYSQIIRFEGVRERYCIGCIEKMANWNGIKI